METLYFEQLKALLEILTNKTWIDYIPIILSSAAPLLAVGMSYYFFNKQSVHVMNEKIIEKEVEKLYEAADSFFDYSDSINLFFSMMEKRLSIAKSQGSMPEIFVKQCEDATNAVFDQFKSVHKAAFLLRTLDEEATAEEIERFINETVDLRKSVLDISRWQEGKTLKEELGADIFQQNLSQKREYFKGERNKCLEKIAECKKRIKAV